MPIWYSLTWNNADREWHHTMSFSRVSLAKQFAAEFAPDDATHFKVKNVSSGDYVIERSLNGGGK
jgi:hypothetical protein